MWGHAIKMANPPSKIRTTLKFGSSSVSRYLERRMDMQDADILAETNKKTQLILPEESTVTVCHRRSGDD